MELRRYLKVIRHRWLIIVLSILVACGYAYATRPTGVVYSSRAIIYVGSRQFSQALLSYDQSFGIERVARTFAIMISSEAVAADAIQATGVPRTPASVAGSTFAGLIPGTSLISVAYADIDPITARLVTNGLADALVSRVQNYEPGAVAKEGDVPQLPAYVFERARVPVAPDSSGTTGHFTIRIAFGLVLALGIAFVIDYLDLTVKTSDDIERRTKLRVLGVVPLYVTGDAFARPPNVTSTLKPVGVADG